MSTDTAHDTTACPDCRGYGPQARADGHRFDGAGLDFPAPCCGTTARQAMLRRVSSPVLTARDLAIDVVLSLPALVHFAREHEMEREPLESLARLVVDTAHHRGLSYDSMMLVPWDALSVAAREWQRTEQLRSSK